MSQEQDKAFFRNFSLIVGALAVMMVIFMIAARIIGTNEEANLNRQAAEAAKNTAPVGEVTAAKAAAETAPAPAATEATPAPAMETAPAPAATEAATTETTAAGEVGMKVYDGLCKTCHGSGIPGIPQKGDKAAWEPRIAQGMDTLYQHALHGFTGKSGMMMPPKGGGTNTDDEVKAAVDYMVAAVEGGMAATATAAVSDAAAAESPAGADGKKVYEGLCKTCHGSGIPGIPQFGDKAAWEPRIAQGKDTLYQHALHGFTGKSGMMMPPKGGGTNTDDEVKAAVDYMVSSSE